MSMNGGVFSLRGKTLVACEDQTLLDLVGRELSSAGIRDVTLSSELPEKIHPSFANILFLGRRVDLPFAASEAEGKESFKLSKREHEGTRYWTILSGSPRGQFYGFLEFLDGRDQLEDGPAFEIRGVVEGFYGPPWRWEDRGDILDFISSVRMNTYIYAPKDDPYHREKWREPYGEEIMEHFSFLAEQARSRFVDFCYALSPGLSIDHASADDLDAVVAKLRQFYDVGIRTFAIFLDDIPEDLKGDQDKERFSSLGEAQRVFVTKLLERMKTIDTGISMFFCPTEYHGVEKTEYHTEISKLPEEIEIFWTGPRICSKSISADEAEKMMGAFGRRLLIWDNYPVNDYDRSLMNLNAVRNRDPGLPDSCRGVLTNPMSEAQASKVAILTYAEYLWDPKGYEPERSLDRALTYIFGPQALPLARTLTDSLVDFFFDEDSERTAWLIKALKEGDDVEMERALRRFEEMSEVVSLLECLENERLVEELRQHVEKVSDLGRIGQLYLQRILLSRRVNLNRAKVLSDRIVEILTGL